MQTSSLSFPKEYLNLHKSSDFSEHIQQRKSLTIMWEHRPFLLQAHCKLFLVPAGFPVILQPGVILCLLTTVQGEEQIDF